MSDFYLLDTYGAFKCLAVHPDLEVVAYDTGCMVIVWNVHSDSKISLLKHEFEVVLIKFIESYDFQQELLLTVDCSGVGCLWDLDNGVCVHEFRFSSRKKLDKVYLHQFPGTMTFCAGEAD
jgi:WD40 repeat protein